MHFTRSTTARRPGRLLAATLVPIAVAAACGGGGGGGQQAQAAGTAVAKRGDPATTTTTATTTAPDPAAGGEAPTTTAPDDTGVPDWCHIATLMGDKVTGNGPGAALTYPQLVEQMQGAHPSAEASPYWTNAETVLAKPGFDPQVIG